MPHIKSGSNYSHVWDLEFMHDISGDGAFRVGAKYAGFANSPNRQTGLGLNRGSNQSLRLVLSPSLPTMARE